MGIVWALFSVVLASGAQLLLRAAMLALPPVNDLLALFWHLIQFQSGTGLLFLGLCGYVASMGCWFFALRQLPLAKAYALLSLSYIAVWSAALLFQNEAFSWQGLAGVLMVIFAPQRR